LSVNAGVLLVAGIAHTEPGEDACVPLDIDVLSPAPAPGTGTPEPGGLDHSCELSDLLCPVVRRGSLVGMDVI
jgi:arginase family enzyme